MLRRALLPLLLAAPLAAQAESLTFSPTVLGKNDCESSTEDLNLSWTVTQDGSVAIVPGTDVWRVQVSQVSGCPSSDTTTKQIGSDISATTLSGSAAFNRTTFLSDGAVACSTPDTVYVCINLFGTDGVSKGAVTGSIQYSLTAPPVPTNVTVSPGDQALYVSWSAGTGSTVAADHYEVTMTALDASGNPGAVQGTQSFTSTSGRYSGLTNGVTYQATVVAVSAAGNASAPSEVKPASKGTPAPVMDYWDQYLAAGGTDPGGCGGGPAGALSLLGLAALLRVARRRS